MIDLSKCFYNNERTVIAFVVVVVNDGALVFVNVVEAIKFASVPR